MAERKALFFLRHYNDIDHTVPIIYKWATTTQLPAAIVLTGDRHYLEDYRIRFLRGLSGVRIYSLAEMLHDPNAPPEPETNHSLDPLIDSRASLYKILQAPQIAETLIESMFQDVDQGVVTFDWIMADFVQNVINVAHKHGLTTISLPHGDASHINRMLHVNELDYSHWKGYGKLAAFDYVIVPNNLCRQRYSPFMEPERIPVLGSPRFNDEWTNILSPLISSYDDFGGKEDLKVAFLLRAKNFPIFWEEVCRSIAMLLRFPRLYLVVKQHTRYGTVMKELQPVYDGMKLASHPRFRLAHEDVHTGSLLKWADVILDMSTSAAFEAVMRRIPVLEPEYLHAGRSTIAHYISASDLQYRDQLFNRIKTFHDNPKTLFYDEAQRERFIREVIHYPDDLVLNRYVQFLLKCMEKKRVKPITVAHRTASVADQVEAQGNFPSAQQVVPGTRVDKGAQIMQKEELRRRYQQGLQELQRNNRGFQIFTRETWEVGEHPSGYGEFESAFAARHVNQIKPKAVLDIGSYRHFVLGLLGMYDVTTLDVRHREQSCPNETVIVCDAKKLDLPDCSYDLVVSLSSIEHFGLGRYGDEIDLDGDIKAVKEMIRVLKPGGRLIISTTITHTAPSIVFNAHRVYSFEKLQAMFRELMYVEEAFFSRELQASCTREQITQKPGEWDSYCGCWEKPGRVEGIEEPQASVQKVSKIEIQSLKVPNSSETLKALCKTPHPINPEIIAPLAITDSAEAVEALFYDHLPFPNENQTQVFRNYLRLVEIAFHAGCRAVLELGTGYSTSLWARYAERTGAEVVSLDVHADRILERLQPCGEAERIRRSVKVVQAASITAQDLESFYLSKPRTEFCGVQVKEMLMYIAALTSQVCDKDLYNAVVNLVGGANSHPAAILLPDENHLHFPKELLRLYAQGQNFRNELDFLDTLTEKMPVGVLDQWIAEGRTWDFIFFDSGEFPGMVEWSKLKSSIVPGGFAALHDIFFPKSIKSMLVAASLFADPDWRVVLLDNSTWQGMLVAQRVR